MEKPSSSSSSSSSSSKEDPVSEKNHLLLLNFKSKDFDAKKFLFAKPNEIDLPVNVAPLEHFHAARKLLPPGSHKDAPNQEKANRFKIVRIESKSEIEQLQKKLEEKHALQRKKVQEEEKVKLVTKEKVNKLFTNPLDALVDKYHSIAEEGLAGPLSLLSKAAKEKIPVKVRIRRVDGIRGACVGLLRSFDRHFNLLMLDVEEEYTCYEYVQVSSDGFKCNLEHKLRQFYEIYNTENKAISDETLANIAQRYQNHHEQLWEKLHKKYGLIQRVKRELVRGLETSHGAQDAESKAKKMLCRYAGREPVLFQKLGIADEKEKKAKFGNQRHLKSDYGEYNVRAEWICKESAKYPGRFFYRNTKTKKSVWMKPEGVKFKTIKYLATRKRYLPQVLIRGDNVISCQPI